MLNSDEVLFRKKQEFAELVKKYAENNDLFIEQFSESIIKIGNISPLSFDSKKLGGYLYLQFYDFSCPRAQEIVKSILSRAVANEPRIDVSLLRLHFHPCRVVMLHCC